MSFRRPDGEGNGDFDELADGPLGDRLRETFSAFADEARSTSDWTDVETRIAADADSIRWLAPVAVAAVVALILGAAALTPLLRVPGAPESITTDLASAGEPDNLQIPTPADEVGPEPAHESTSSTDSTASTTQAVARTATSPQTMAARAPRSPSPATTAVEETPPGEATAPAEVQSTTEILDDDEPSTTAPTGDPDTDDPTALTEVDPTDGSDDPADDIDPTTTITGPGAEPDPCTLVPLVDIPRSPALGSPNWQANVNQLIQAWPKLSGQLAELQRLVASAIGASMDDPRGMMTVDAALVDAVLMAVNAQVEQVCGDSLDPFWSTRLTQLSGSTIDEVA